MGYRRREEWKNHIGLSRIDEDRIVRIERYSGPNGSNSPGRKHKRWTDSLDRTGEHSVSED